MQQPDRKEIALTASGRSWSKAASKAFVFGMLALVLSGPVETLHKRRVPRSVSAAFILMLTLILIAATVALLRTPAQDWLAKAPQTMAMIRHKASPVTKFFSHLDDLRT